MKLFERGGRRNSGNIEPVQDLRFAARCPAGHSIEGRRAHEFQAIRCPECGEGIFILPTSWLPVPPSAHVVELIPLHAVGQIRASNIQPDNADEDEVELEESVQPVKNRRRDDIELKQHRPEKNQVELADDPAARFEVQRTTNVSEAELTRLARAEADRRATKKPDRASAEMPDRKAESRQDLPEDDNTGTETENEIAGRRSLLPRPSPKVAIAAVVVLVIGLTIFLQLRNRHREQLPHLAQRGRTEGIQKLKEGKFDEAKQILAAAAGAYREMNDKSETARQVIHASLEAAIMADLVARPLDDIIDKFAAGGSGAGEFEALDKGRSLIVQSRVISTPENGGRFDIDYRIAIGPGPASARPLGRLNLDDLKLMNDLKPAVGDQLLIGCRLKKLELADGEWLVRLEPDSGVQITDWEALGTLGWPVTDRQVKADGQ